MKMAGINSVTPPIQTGIMQGADTVSKKLQNQITKKQQELQKLTSDKDMEPKKKLEKQQEITKEIASLNQQLRRHEEQLRKEQRKEQLAKIDGKQVENPDEKNKEQTKSQSDVQKKDQTDSEATNERAMISANTSVQQANMQGNVASQLDKQANIISAEIKQDQRNGTLVEAKEKEFESVRKRADRASMAQFKILGYAQTEMKGIQKPSKEHLQNELDKNELGRRVNKYKQKTFETVNFTF